MAASPVVVLPTLDRLGLTSAPTDVDAHKVATLWFDSLTKYVASNDIDGILSLFASDAWFRDMLAFTWAFRTFQGAPKIRKFLQDRLAASKPAKFALVDAKLETPYPDLAWILGRFTFETETGLCSGIFRLVPSALGTWTGFTFYTNLEDLKAFPEKTGPLRNFPPNHGKWKAQREREREFVDSNPTVLIIGGGQSGLDVAARLRMLDIPTLVVEKNAQIGDQWRNRYQALCLHDPVCECARLPVFVLAVNFLRSQGMTICPISRECSLCFDIFPPVLKRARLASLPHGQSTRLRTSLQGGWSTTRRRWSSTYGHRRRW